MSLPTPNLDDRTFADIVEEAKKMIPAKCPQWTDFNPSDPGITLVELLAWMTEMIIYRLNRIPEKNYIKFIELMGAALRPQQPAKTWVVFKTAARTVQNKLEKVPARTKLSTANIEGEQVEFETIHELQPSAAQFIKVCLQHLDKEDHKIHTDDLYPRAQVVDADPLELPVFLGEEGVNIGLGQEGPEGAAHVLYVALDLGQLSSLLVRLLPAKQAASVNITWQYSTKSGWQDIKPIKDGTHGLTQTGTIEFDHFQGWTQRPEFKIKGYWLRAICRLEKQSGGPRLKGLHLNTVEVIQAKSHCGEVLGSSTGEPYQTYWFVQRPLLPDPEIIVREKEQLSDKEVHEMKRLLKEDVIDVPESPGLWIRWHATENFYESKPTDRHYMLDLNKGEISFGNAKRGMVPPIGRDNIKANIYFTGGGTKGNVGKNTITVLNTPVASVNAVSNPEPASGGADRETIEEAKLRAPWMLKHRYRAVTISDFEELAKEASGEVAKAYCFADEGRIKVIIVPKNHGNDLNTRLELNPMLLQQVKAYLDQRRLITTQLTVVGPGYKVVYVEARIVLLPEKSGIQLEIEQYLQKELRRFFHPLIGGTAETGWPLGRSIHISEIYYLLERIDGVDYVDEVKLKESQEGDSQAKITMRDSDGERTYPDLKQCMIETRIVVE